MGLQNLVGKRIFFTDTRHTAEAFLLDQPYTITSIQKSLLGEATVTVEQHTPTYLLQTLDTVQFIVFENGQVKKGAINETDLPLYTVFFASAENITNNYFEPKRHTPLLQLTKDLEKSSLKVSALSWKEERLLQITLENSVLVYLDPTLLVNKVATLTAVLASPEFQELQNVTEIDLRFELPVLRTRE